MSNLEGITSTLGREYTKWKSAEKKKDKSKGEFFKAIDASFDEDELATHVYDCFGEEYTEESAKAEALREFPRYEVVDVSEQIDDPGYAVLLREDRKFQPYSYVNHSDGKVYSRQISEGSPMLDDEALKEGDPELYDAITSTKEVTVIKPLEEMTPDQLARIADYVYPGKIQVKLAAPRKAKEEELDGS